VFKVLRSESAWIALARILEANEDATKICERSERI